MENPLLATDHLPDFSAIDATHVVPAVEQVLSDNRAAISAITATMHPPTWANFIQPLEQRQNTLNRVWSPISHLNAVMNSPALREAYNVCLPKLSEYSTELAQNVQLFEGYCGLQAGAEYAHLSQAQQTMITQAIRDFKLAGVDLSADKKARLKSIKQRLSTLSNDFQDNVLDATRAWSYALDSVQALSGLPESSIALAKQTAEQAGQPGWLLTLDFPIYHAVMSFADDAALRKTLYSAYQTRASDQGPQAGQWDNTAVMAEILALRHELSQLLGFPHYAAYSLVKKMAQSSDQVMAFLHDLAAKAKPVADADMAALRAFASNTLHLSVLQPWDVQYVSEKMKLAQFDFSPEDLKPYFPVDRVLSGLFAVVEKLFSIQVEEQQTQPVWHDAVRFFCVMNAERQPMGYFYLDLYAREDKRGGAWMDECVVRKKDDQGLQLPVAYLTCNFTPPVTGQPTLLTHTEMTTLFHEFGHGLHHLLTTVDVLSVAGINGVAWDAVELPSQFLENWCWEKTALALMSGHWQTHEPLPDALFDKLWQAKNFQSGLHMVRQLEFALFDFRIHREYSDDMLVYSVLKAVRDEVAVMQLPAENRFAHGFSHIFAGGYAAGYYSYKWAEVLSSDAFAKFEETGIFNAETGQHFLHTILENGGSEAAMDLFVRFRSREPSIDALLRHCGIC